MGKLTDCALKIFTSSFLLFPALLSAQEVDDVIFKLENNPPPFFPFSFGGSYITIEKAPVTSPELEGKELIFNQAEAVGVYTHPLSYQSGLNFGAGWVSCEVNLQDNPHFNQTKFSYVNLLIGTYTAIFCDWFWKASVAAYFDTDEFSLIDYTLYQGVAWGKYEFNEWLELDFGFIVETGLSNTKVWPLIGFICNPFPRWEIHAVFPVDICIDYTVTDCLAASGSLRFLRSRHRLQQNEPSSQGVFNYQATGVEFDLTYAPFVPLSITGYIGSTLGGDLKVGDRMDRHATHHKFQSSFYTGVTALLSF